MDLVKDQERRTRKQSTEQSLPVRLTILQRIKRVLFVRESKKQNTAPGTECSSLAEDLNEHVFVEDDGLIKQSNNESSKNRIDSCSLTIAISEC